MAGRLRARTPILALILAVFSLGAIAHDSVVVVPLGAGDPPECFILGIGVECMEDGVVRVPLGFSIPCSSASTNEDNELIGFTHSASYVEFDIGTLLSSRLNVVIRDEKNTDFLIEFVVFILPSGDTLFYSQSPLASCTPPTPLVDELFSVAGHDWTMVPEFSSDGSSVTVEAMKFVRQ